jgi:hypothetical protein
MDSPSVSYTAGFEVDQNAETLFPLFSPEGEKLWVPGWDYKNIMGTTTLHEDYVFLTESHDHAAVAAVWIVKHYDPEAYHVQYYKIEPGEKVGIVRVVCTPLNDSSTRVDVTYTYIGLSERGNRFTANFTKEDYEDFIREWKELLEAYFKERPHSLQD